MTKALFRIVYILPWLFTVAIIAVLWRLLLDPERRGQLPAHWRSASSTDRSSWLADPTLALPAVTFINIWAGYPFFMISLLAGLQGISADLYEAAAVDGASAVQRFCNVTLPQLKPIIISMAVLDLIWTSQQFALIWMTTGGGPLNATEMLSTYTYKLAFSSYEFAHRVGQRRGHPAVIDGPGLLLRAPPEGEGLTWSDRKQRRRARCKIGVLAGLCLGARLRRPAGPVDAVELVQVQHRDLRVPPQLITENFSFDAYVDDPHRPREAAVLPQQLHRRAAR